MNCRHCGNAIGADPQHYTQRDGTTRLHNHWFHVNPPVNVGRIYCSYKPDSPKAEPAVSYAADPA